MRICAHLFHIVRINKILSCARADRLQTCICSTFSKPSGSIARINISQVDSPLYLYL